MLDPSIGIPQGERKQRNLLNLSGYHTYYQTSLERLSGAGTFQPDARGWGGGMNQIPDTGWWYEPDMVVCEDLS